jgi:glycosyltransferase involved in cell wall biosynthesis
MLKMRTMRITIIGGPFQPWPPAPCGSVERIWHGLAREFAAAGHCVTAITQRHPTQPRREVMDGVEYLRKWRFPRTRNIKRDVALDMLFSLRMLALAPRADIVVPHAFWLPYLLPRLRWRAGKVVAHVQRFPKGQTRLYLRAATITTVSQAIADAIIAQCPRARDLVRVIPNPIHTGVFVPSDGPSLTSGNGARGAAAGGGDGVIVYTGRVHPEKGLDLLVRAYAMLRTRFPALRLRIIGPSEVSRGGGGPDFVAGLKALAGGAPIEFVPPIDDVYELASILRAADYYCYPSVAEKGEASPVAPLEAMAVGLPTVVSDLAQFRGYLQPDHNGLVFDHRADNAADLLAERLGRLVADPQLRASLGRHALQTARKFSYPAVASMYLEEFDRVLDSDSPPVRDCGTSPPTRESSETPGGIKADVDATEPHEAHR